MPLAVPPIGEDAVVTLAPTARTSHVVTRITYSYSAVPVGGRLTVKDEAAVRFDQDLTAAQGTFATPICSDLPGSTMTVTLFSGGASVQGKLVVESSLAN